MSSHAVGKRTKQHPLYGKPASKPSDQPSDPKPATFTDPRSEASPKPSGPQRMYDGMIRMFEGETNPARKMMLQNALSLHMPSKYKHVDSLDELKDVTSPLKLEAKG